MCLLSNLKDLPTNSPKKFLKSFKKPFRKIVDETFINMLGYYDQLSKFEINRYITLIILRGGKDFDDLFSSMTHNFTNRFLGALL